MTVVALLTNPDAGAGEAGEVERELRGLGAEVTNHPIQAGESGIDGSADRIAVAGGDGSIGCAAEAAARAGVPLAVIPAGTANDFARVLGLPDDLPAACRLAVHGERLRTVKLGRMGNRPFVNAASIGLPPAAADRARGLKRRLGAPAYVVGAIRAGLEARPVDCRIAAPGAGELFAGRVWQATVACSGAFGAGSRIKTNPADRMLDAVVVEAGSRLGLARRAYGMRSAGLEQQAGVQSWRAAAFELAVAPGTAVNVDGELCVRSGPIPFSVDRRPVDVVVG